MAWSRDGRRLYALVRDGSHEGRVTRAERSEDGTVAIGQTLATPTPVADWTLAIGGCSTDD